jgi:hypothetical protein
MIIPKDAIIADEKIRDYLLVPQDEDDKSQFLAMAGYSKEDFWELVRDIREQILPAKSTFQYDRGYGPVFAHRGTLRGPNGVLLTVRTIWIQNLSGEFRFVTLIPDKERYRNEIRTL